MEEQKFKQDFIACFLASWCATNYVDYCMRGMQEELENPPVEDAEHLADSAWEKILDDCNIEREPKYSQNDVDVLSAAIDEEVAKFIRRVAAATKCDGDNIDKLAVEVESTVENYQQFLEWTVKDKATIGELRVDLAHAKSLEEIGSKFISQVRDVLGMSPDYGNPIEVIRELMASSGKEADRK